ncbi:MAG: DUF2304 domain-containing protein [Anaerolineae bacterium]|nr:DUF2304 domain-containing protein [Anaerolineae bacterium]MDW8172969.1 DUF2304 domain-containing protein [Anaerolineae bacterium]
MSEMDRSVVLAVLAALAAFLLVLELVRRRRLREDYSLLWLFVAVAMIVVAAWRELLHGLAALVGIAYPPNLLFLLALLFIFGLLLYFSTVITRLTQESKRLAQEVALLRQQLQRLEQAQAVAHPAYEQDQQQPERVEA